MSGLPKPFYEDGSVTIYHGDALELLPDLEADVLVTDPPYGTRFSHNNPKGGYGRRQNAGLGPEGFTIANDDTTETRDEVLAVWGDGPALLFGSPRLPDPPGTWDDRLVWDKTRPGMNGGPWRYVHESIYVRGEWNRVSNSAVSIIRAWPDQSQHIHAKPLTLMVALVGAAPDGVILDPFSGSGTTGMVALRHDRSYIGLELNPEYVELSRNRIRDDAPLLNTGIEDAA